jgi:hypothetical protein
MHSAPVAAVDSGHTKGQYSDEAWDLTYAVTVQKMCLMISMPLKDHP